MAARADGTAAVDLSGGAAPAADVKWEVRTGAAVVASGTFAGPAAATLDTSGGANDFVALAWADTNGDGVPDGGEPQAAVNVHVLTLDALTVTAARDSGDAVTAANGQTQNIFLQTTRWSSQEDGGDPYTDFVAHADFAPGTAGGADVLYSMVKLGTPAQPETGNFQTNDVALAFNYDRRTGGGTVALTAGVDANHDGKLDPGEVTRTIDLTIVDLTVSKVSYSAAAGGPGMVTLQRDDGSGAFGAAWWPDGAAYKPDPLCYSAGATIAANVEFTDQINTLPADAQVTVSGDATDNGIKGGDRYAFDAAAAALAVADPRKYRGTVQAKNAIPSVIINDALSGHWRASLDGGKSWIKLGDTKNQLYVVGGTPSAPRTRR